MDITIEQLLKGKPTIIKNNQYYETQQYVEPFLEEMSKFTNNFIVKVQEPTQLTISNGLEDMTYNRVWVQAVMPEQNCIENHDEVYGLLYGLDTRIPVYKVYRGMLNRACTNLCVFDPQWMEQYALKSGENFKYSIKGLMERVSDFESKIKYMKNTTIDGGVDARQKLLGQMIEKSLLEEYKNINGKVKISPTSVIKAHEYIYHDDTSKYYTGNNDTTLFNFYNAFTQIVTDDKKDIMNKFEKTLLINSLFDL